MTILLIFFSLEVFKHVLGGTVVCKNFFFIFLDRYFF